MPADIAVDSSEKRRFHAKLELVWPSSVLPFYKMYEFDDVKQVVHSRFNLKIGIKAI